MIYWCPGPSRSNVILPSPCGGSHRIARVSPVWSQSHTTHSHSHNYNHTAHLTWWPVGGFDVDFVYSCTTLRSELSLLYTVSL